MKILALFLIMIAGALNAAVPPNFGELRFIDGGRVDGKQLFGLEIDLNEAEGWKTYWRLAGQNGLNPNFDFSQSENVAEVATYWPEPHLIGEEGVEAVGYSEDVLIVFEITPEDVSQPISLNLNATLGVCQNICLPVQEQLQISLNPNYSIDSAVLQLAKSQAFDEGEYTAQTELRAEEFPILIEWEDNPNVGQIIASGNSGTISPLIANGKIIGFPLGRAYVVKPDGLERID